MSRITTQDFPQGNRFESRKTRWFTALLLGGILAADSVAAATFTVGDSGTHEILQEAIEAAVASADSMDTVLVQAGFHFDCLNVSSDLSSGTLLVSGGWNSSFTSQTLDPAMTSVDCEGFFRTLHVESSGSSELTFENLTLSGGLMDDFGAGVAFLPSDSASLILRDVILSGHDLIASNSLVRGGAVYAYQGAGTSLAMIRCRVVGIVTRVSGALTNDPMVTGGSIYVNTTGSFTMTNSVVETSDVESVGEIQGAGLYIHAGGDSEITLTDNIVRDILVFDANDVVLGVGLILLPAANSVIELRRNRFLDNLNLDSGIAIPYQVWLGSGDSADLTFTDSIVAQTIPSATTNFGLFYRSDSGAGTVARFTNLTVVNQRLYLNPSTGTTSMFNSILYGSTTTINNTTVGDNLEGVDPLFVSAEDGDFRLRPGSPAIDAGTNSPIGGLGPWDVDGDLRIVGPLVDQGAHEHAFIFLDGFESGDLDAWD